MTLLLKVESYPMPRQEPREYPYRGEVAYCAICDEPIYVDDINAIGTYEYIRMLGYVCYATDECRRENALEALRRGTE